MKRKTWEEKTLEEKHEYSMGRTMGQRVDKVKIKIVEIVKIIEPFLYFMLWITFIITFAWLVSQNGIQERENAKRTEVQRIINDLKEVERQYKINQYYKYKD